MRVLRVAYEAGRDLFDVFWNFLQSGGVIVPSSGGAMEGEPVLAAVRIRSLKKEWHFRSRIARLGGDGRAWVAFDPGQEQEAMVNAAWADTYAVPERKHRRYSVRADVNWRQKTDPDLRASLRKATITNLSRGGCCLETDERLPVGTVIRVEGDNLSVDAQVRWAKRPPSRELGLEFATPIDGELLR